MIRAKIERSCQLDMWYCLNLLYSRVSDWLAGFLHLIFLDPPNTSTLLQQNYSSGKYNLRQHETFISAMPATIGMVGFISLLGKDVITPPIFTWTASP